LSVEEKSNSKTSQMTS